ncbi:MAG TPA: zinc-binding dehydrogenase, partial [Amycolatopsis sp.]|nr:zinc-binding dehydrogenase [Amycolatopsis sp.]
EVAAVGLNPVDIQTRAGIGAEHHRVHPPMVAGWDVSGVVRVVGAGVHDLRAGDPVIAMSAQPATGVGTAAQFVALKRDIVGHAPVSLPLPHAAALPLAGLTAEQALGKAGPASGRTLLVIGAAGAVGGVAAQLARRDGWRVLGVGRRGDTDAIRAVGAEETFAGLHEVPAEVADVVLDTAGVPEAISSVRDGGVFLTITPRAVPEAERGVEVIVSFVEQDGPALTRLSQLVDREELTVRVARDYRFDDAAKAHEDFGAGGVRGKILLIPPAVDDQEALA